MLRWRANRDEEREREREREQVVVKLQKALPEAQRLPE